MSPIKEKDEILNKQLQLQLFWNAVQHLDGIASICTYKVKEHFALK